MQIPHRDFNTFRTSRPSSYRPVPRSVPFEYRILELIKFDGTRDERRKKRRWAEKWTRNGTGRYILLNNVKIPTRDLYEEYKILFLKQIHKKKRKN